MLRTRCTNKTIITGFLSKDADWRKVGDDISLCTFPVGLPYEDTDSGSDSTHWESHNIEVWRGLANACRGLKKGSKVLIEGTLRKKVWTDGDNNSQSRSYILGDRVEFLSSKSSEEPSAD